MATLLNKQTGEKITLVAQHIFGRHPDASNTVLLSEDVSRMHAVIFWEGEQWILKDTSTNGTFINGKMLIRGEKNRLNQEDKINFGSTLSDTWELLNSDAPKCMLTPLKAGLPTIELDSIIALPSENAPEVTLYLTAEGQWICESPIGTNRLESGDLVGTHENMWRFIDANPTVETRTIEKKPVASPHNIEFFFHVSQNEEHVSLTLKIDTQKFELGERTHHYLILVLARQRLADKAKKLTEREQGWVNKGVLSGMLGLSEDHINIQIYRFRKQITSALPKSLVLHQTIERRTGELRFAHSVIQIDGGLPLKNYIDNCQM